MLSAAHELPEGGLIFLTDRQELYVRLRGGFRRVLVSWGWAEGSRGSTLSWVALPGSEGLQVASCWGFSGILCGCSGIPPILAQGKGEGGDWDLMCHVFAAGGAHPDPQLVSGESPVSHPYLHPSIPISIRTSPSPPIHPIAIHPSPLDCPSSSPTSSMPAWRSTNPQSVSPSLPPQDNEVYDKPPSIHYAGPQPPLQPRGPLHPLHNHSPLPTARPWRGDEVVANQHRLPEQPLLHHQHELLNSYYIHRRPDPAPVAAHVHQDFQPAVSAMCQLREGDDGG